MQLLLNFITALLLLCVLSASKAGILPASEQRPFAYERGKCDYSVSEIFEGLIQNKIRSLITPPIHTVKQESLLQFDLYTPLNPQARQILRPGDLTSLKNSNFNPRWPLRVVIHGWTGGSQTCYNAALKDAYLSKGDYNIIILDWSRQALDVKYTRVTKQLVSIAGTLSKFLRFLNNKTGIPYDRIYLVGHSIGSHLAGLTGKLLKTGRLGAIFALDPAGLTQLNLGPTERLAPTDATYVEAIHTELYFLGNSQGNEISHAAFFVNWGLGQPQCPNATAVELDFACDHLSSIYYFAESIRRPKLFGAIRCNSLKSVLTTTCSCTSGNRKTLTCAAETYMGGEVAVPKRGLFYLSTRPQPPFGTGDNLVHMKPPVPSTVQETSARIKYY